MPTAQATTDKHKFTQIENNNQSVFIRVHLWFELSFLKCRERLLMQTSEFMRLRLHCTCARAENLLLPVMNETIGERHGSACRYKNEVPEG